VIKAPFNHNRRIGCRLKCYKKDGSFPIQPWKTVFHTITTNSERKREERCPKPTQQKREEKEETLIPHKNKKGWFCSNPTMETVFRITAKNYETKREERKKP
jgi:hypothetical protein